MGNQSDLLLLEDHHLQDHEEEEEVLWDNLEDEIKEITGYKFKNPSLLEHLNQDKTSTTSYERLEYMGDAVLNFLMTKKHFAMHPKLPPGQLTKPRAANVDNEKLARVALKYKLHSFLRHKNPFLARRIKDFEEAIMNYPIHSYGLINAPKALADVVESLVGAIYVDSNSIDGTCKIVENLLQPMITPSTLHTHLVTMLHELCQKNNVKLESRDMWKETGEIGFIVDGEFVGKAKYKDKRVVANNRAAHEAYRKIVTKLRLE